MQKDLLLDARPSWWNFVVYLLFFWLIIPLLIVLWKRAYLRLLVYPDRIILEKGVLSRNLTEVFISDIRTVNITQTFLQRIFNVGNVSIASSGTTGYEEVAKGLPNPLKIRELIVELRSKQGIKDD
jgi:uncharacterized membrane protein YdbT with pleckstrin-like domain